MNGTGDVLSMAVNEVIRRHPATLEIFNRHGIDSCCGGSATVAAAALRDRADVQALGDELARAIRAAIPA